MSDTDNYIKYHEIASGWIADYAGELEERYGTDTFRKRVYPWMVGYIVAEFMAGNGKPAGERISVAYRAYRFLSGAPEFAGGLFKAGPCSEEVGIVQRFMQDTAGRFLNLHAHEGSGLVHPQQ